MSDADNGNEKKIVISLSVLPEIRDTLKTSAKQVGKSVSGLVSDLIQRHLGLIVNDGQEIPVILKIPQDLRSDPDKLRVWLNTRVDGIVQKLSTVG